MATKKLVKKATVTGGYGNVPGYGKVTNPTSSGSAWAGGMGSSIQAGANAALNPPTFTPQTPPPDPYAAAKAQYNTLLGSATNSANRQYGYTLGDSIYDEGTGALDLGATLGARDPNADPATATQGSYDWNTVEANNPFSKAGLLMRSYRQQQNRTTNGYAAQGQLYSGSMLNQQGQDTFGFQSGQNELQKALTALLTGGARTRRDAGVTKDDTINNAGLAGLQALLGNG